MMLNVLMLDNTQGLPFPATESRDRSEKSRGRLPDFKDILGNTIKVNDNKSYQSSSPNRPVKSREESLQGTENQPRLKTYRDIKNEMRTAARKTSLQDKKEVAADYSTGEEPADKEKKVAAGDGTVNAMINCIAQVLGLNRDELKALLDSADITPEEFSTMADVKELSSKMSEVLGLDVQQENTLASMLEMVGTQVKTLMEGKKIDPEKLEADLVVDAKVNNDLENTEKALTGIKVRVDDTASGSSDFQAMLVKLKLKLQELGGKLADNEDGLSDEVSIKVGNFLKDILESLKATEPLKATEIPVKPENPAASENPENKDESALAGIKTPVPENKPETGTDEAKNAVSLKDEKEDGKEVETAVKPTAETTVKETAKQEQVQSAVTVVNQVQKNEPAADVDRLAAKSPIPAREIINQVVEKAKVILTGDKSEMVMDLQPDSLGKLSLKVVTEHGMVMAKFVAENQQVKQVLETNMQILKDSLEKQGLNVQGFSVSVRQDTQGGNRSNYQQDDSRQAISARTVYSGDRMLETVGNMDRLQRTNPYYMGNSTVNFTA